MSVSFMAWGDGSLLPQGIMRRRHWGQKVAAPWGVAHLCTRYLLYIASDPLSLSVSVVLSLVSAIAIIMATSSEWAGTSHPGSHFTLLPTVSPGDVEVWWWGGCWSWGSSHIKGGRDWYLRERTFHQCMTGGGRIYLHFSQDRLSWETVTISTLGRQSCKMELWMSPGGGQLLESPFPYFTSLLHSCSSRLPFWKKSLSVCLLGHPGWENHAVAFCL